MASIATSEDCGVMSTETLPFMFVEWKIPDSHLLSRVTSHRIHSPSFQFKDSTWYLRVIINDEKHALFNGTYGAIESYLVKKDSVTSTLRISYHMGIKAVNGKHFRNHSSEYIFDRNKAIVEQCCGTINLSNRLDFYHNKFSLAPNGITTFYCCFAVETAGKFGAFYNTNPFKSTTTGITSTEAISDISTSNPSSSTGVTCGTSSTEKISDTSTSNQLSSTVFTFGKASTEKISDTSASNQTSSTGFTFGHPLSLKYFDFHPSNKSTFAEISKLLTDFKNLFISGEDSDIVIKVKGTDFKAHKNILRARSSVFHSMFSHDMVEKNTGTVDIIDCEPEAFKIFLLYIYSGNIENLSMNTVFDLYGAADKYDAEELKLKCKEFMVSNLSVDTICDVIEHVLQHKEEELLKTATKFFTRNFKKVILTVKWQSFLKRNAVAANELLIKASNFYVFKS